MIPYSIDGGFSLFQAMTNVAKSRPSLCEEILKILEAEGITTKYFSLCNWVCFNAHTLEYHQDKDASYSLICVPHVNYDDSEVYMKNKGSYAFSFCWNESFQDNSKISFHLESGVGVYFLGPSCSHRQECLEEGIFLNMSSYSTS